MKYSAFIYLLSIYTFELHTIMSETIYKEVLKKTSERDFVFIDEDSNFPIHVLEISQSNFTFKRYNESRRLTNEITHSLNNNLNDNFTLNDEFEKKLVEIIYNFQDKDKYLHIEENEGYVKYTESIYNLMRNLKNYSHYINDDVDTESYLEYDKILINNPSFKNLIYAREPSSINEIQHYDNLVFNFSLTPDNKNTFIYNIDMNLFDYKEYLEYYLKKIYDCKEEEVKETMSLLSLIKPSASYLNYKNSVSIIRANEFVKYLKNINRNNFSLSDQINNLSFVDTTKIVDKKSSFSLKNESEGLFYQNVKKQLSKKLTVRLQNEEISFNNICYIIKDKNSNLNNFKYVIINEDVLKEMKNFFKSCQEFGEENIETILRFIYLTKDSDLYKDTLISILSNKGKARNLIMYEILNYLSLVDLSEYNLNFNGQIINESEYFKRLAQRIMNEIGYHHKNISSIFFDMLMYFEMCDMYKKRLSENNFSKDTMMIFNFFKSLESKSDDIFVDLIPCIDAFLNKTYQKNISNYGCNIYYLFLNYSIYAFDGVINFKKNSDITSENLKKTYKLFNEYTQIIN